MNRRLLVVIGVIAGVVVLLGIIGTLAGDDGGGDPGPAQPVAGCEPMTDVPAAGASDHRAGTIEYDRSPPNSGPHAANWVTALSRVYSVDDAPPVEQIVHNLEHGYVVVWYDPARADSTALVNALEPATTRKLFATPWTRSALPAPFVLTAWGHEQRCTTLSAEAVEAFVDEHGGPNGDAPEPTAP